MFRSAYSERIIFASPCGHSTYSEYVRCKDKNGVDALEKGCDHDIDQELRAAARGADLASIFNRASRGDLSAIGSVDASMFGDLVDAPKNLLEAHQRIFKGQQLFNDLPAEVKAKFNNNATVFMQSIADGSFVKSVADKVTAASKSAKTVEKLSEADIKAIKSMIGGKSDA